MFCCSSKLLSQNHRPGRICKSKFIGVCSAVLAMLNGLSNFNYDGKGIGNCPLHQVKVSGEGFRIRVKCFVCLSCCSPTCRSGEIFKGEFCGSV